MRFRETLIYTRRGSGPVLSLITFAIYFVVAYLSLHVLIASTGLAAVWPADAIPIALMVRMPRQRWGWIVLGMAAAAVLANLSAPFSLPISILYSFQDVIEALMATLILTVGVRRPVDFSKLNHLLRLMLAAGPGIAVTAAAVTVAKQVMTHSKDAWDFWQVWTTAEGLGILLVVPVLLSCTTRELRKLTPARSLEIAILAVGFVFTSFGVFGTNYFVHSRPLIIAVPLLIWAAVRTNVFVTSLLALVFCGFAIYGVLAGVGPYAHAEPTLPALVAAMQMSLMAWVSVGLVMSVVVFDNRRAFLQVSREKERFQLLAVHSPVAIFQSDVEGRCVYVNERWHEITGQEISRALGSGWAEVLHPQDAAQVNADWLEAVRALRDYSGEFRIRRPSSEVRWMRVRVAAWRDPKGAFIGFVGVAIDITDPKRLEQELQERLRFEVLTSDISNSLINVSARNITTAVDQAFVSLSEVMDLDIVALHDCAPDGRWIAVIHRAMDHEGEPQGEPISFESLPWVCAQIRTGEECRIVRLSDLPKEAQIDREWMSERGIKSLMAVPLSVGGQVQFIFSLATARYERSWSDGLTRRLRVLGEAIANSISRAQFNISLQQHEEMLEKLNAALLRAEDNERRRLAAVLHDDLGQTLFAAIAQLVARDNRQASAEPLTPVISMLDEALRQTRELTFDLCPPVLYELGLKAALERLCAQFFRRYGLRATLQAPQAEPALDSELASLLYQAARELLINVIKHAQATEVVVSIDQGDGFTLSVSDNGRGFVEQRKPGKDLPSGFGLFNIRERLRPLGGRVEVAAGSQGGAVVRLILPAILTPSTAAE